MATLTYLLDRHLLWQVSVFKADICQQASVSETDTCQQQSPMASLTYRAGLSDGQLSV